MLLQLPSKAAYFSAFAIAAGHVEEASIADAAPPV
jgi:hypothetical protein